MLSIQTACCYQVVSQTVAPAGTVESVFLVDARESEAVWAAPVDLEGEVLLSETTERTVLVADVAFVVLVDLTSGLCRESIKFRSAQKRATRIDENARIVGT